MKKFFLLSSILLSTLFALSQAQLKPGSGNTLNFDGVDDFISFPDIDGVNDFNTSDNFTVEVWVKIDPVQTDLSFTNNAIIEKWNGSGSYSYVIRCNNQTDGFPGEVSIARYDGTNNPLIFSNTLVNDNKWHHIAFTRTGGGTGTISLYIDGVFQSSTADNTTNPTTNTSLLYVAQRGFGAVRLKGNVDEVRIWNTGLTQTQIRDRMCRKITAVDPLFSNLTAYYNLDESAGTTAFDGTANVNSGTLTNGPVRVTSGAAIGDGSAHDYVNVTKTATLAHPSGESFTVTSASGNPNGIHVYRVDEQPNTLNGASGAGGNNKYFGVFQVNGTSPTYDAVYNYTGNPLVTPGNESSLRLFKRSDNSTTVWSMDVTAPNTVANTISLTGESTEYILGSNSQPLPILLSEFTVRKTTDGKKADLLWTTSFEQNVSHFEIQRSVDGVNYVTIGRINALNTANGTSYVWHDAAPLSKNNYYRLKVVDTDATSKFSPVRILRFGVNETILVYPTVTSDLVFIQSEKQITAQLINLVGVILQNKVVKGSTEFDLSNLPSGTYFIRVSAENKIFKVMKQ